MASESGEPTRRKHHLSPSDEDNSKAENPSKRRKHRHRHHKRHHGHRHHKRSSKKEGKGDDVTEREVELEEKRNDENDAVGFDRLGSHQALSASASGKVAPGSILGIVYDDMEEGEIVEEEEAVDISQRKKKLPSEGSMDEVDGKSGKDDINFVREKHKDLFLQKPSPDDHVANGEVHEHLKDDFVGEEYSQRNGCHNVEEIRRDKRTGIVTEDERKKQIGVSSSPSQDTLHGRSRSGSGRKSPERYRGRSRSQSVLREGSLPDNLKTYDDSYYSKRKHRTDSDDEMVEASRDYRHASKDLPSDKERKHSSVSRYSCRSDRHLSQGTWDRDREGSWDLDRDRRDIDREGSRDLDRNRTGDRDSDRLRAKERERISERERERKRERDRERRGERHRDWEREERERRKEHDRESSRDRRGDGRESSRDRRGDRDEKHIRHSKYNDGDPDRRDVYRGRRRDEIVSKDRLRESEAEKVDSSEVNVSERETEKSKRAEIEAEEYQEKIVSQLAEQNEDEILEKIKEESRRRKQAILEKYKTNILQKQQSQLEHPENEQVEQQHLVVGSEATDDRLGTDDYVAEESFSVGKSPPADGISAFEKFSDTGGLGAGTPKSEKELQRKRSDDMFCDDIFGESPAGGRKTGKGDGLAIERSDQHDNWDDPEGYYSYRFGEILDGRYEIIAAHGKGVFSTVVRAKDLKEKLGEPEEVAIKMIRSNDTMYKAGMEELVILKKLVGADPENKRHCVRFLSSFKYRNHLCLVFESLHMNLREVLKKFGRNIGLKLTAVRAYAKQLFLALKHLKNCGVLHCDIKPDNMLVNEAKNVLKLCDFGNAMFTGKNEITPYLVSRFYRAPEIILGLAYDHPMDMWSVGCCLFEIYTGKVLFPGATNNDMLRLQMELKGLFPKKMVRKAAFKDQHFDQNLNFLATEEDPVTKKAVRRVIINVKPKDFGTLIHGSPGEDPKMLASFKDLLEKVFMLDPDKRITVSQALSHPFITGK